MSFDLRLERHPIVARLVDFCRNTIIPVVFVIVLSGCGGGSGSSASDTEASNLSASELVGKWEFPCLTRDDGVAADSSIEYFFDGAFELIITSYADIFCLHESFETVSRGVVSLGESFVSDDGRIATEIDLHIRNLELAALANEFVDSFNANSTCGIQSWQIGRRFDVSTCINSPGGFVARDLPFTDFSIFQVERDQLFMGNQVANSATGRPTRLLSLPFYVRESGAIGDEFPEDIRGFWELIPSQNSIPNQPNFFELQDRGLISSFTLTQDNCFALIQTNLFSLGMEQFRDPFDIFQFEIFNNGDFLSFRILTQDSAVFYQRTDATSDQLPLCI